MSVQLYQMSDPHGFKIGLSNDPEDRCRSLRGQLQRPRLRVVRTFDTGTDDRREAMRFWERPAHGFYADRAIGNELFVGVTADDEWDSMLEFCRATQQRILAEERRQAGVAKAEAARQRQEKRQAETLRQERAAQAAEREAIELVNDEKCARLLTWIHKHVPDFSRDLPEAEGGDPVESIAYWTEARSPITDENHGMARAMRGIRRAQLIWLAELIEMSIAAGVSVDEVFVPVNKVFLDAALVQDSLDTIRTLTKRLEAYEGAA